MRTVCGITITIPATGTPQKRGSPCDRSGQPHHPGGSSASVTVALAGATEGPMDVDALYQRHRDALLVFLVRRTADTEVALDLWAETFAQAVASSRRYRGTTDAEAAGWLYGIAKRLLAQYYRRGHAEQRALHKLGLERPAATPELIEEIEARAGLEDVRRELGEALAQLSDSVR